MGIPLIMELKSHTNFYMMKLHLEGEYTAILGVLMMNSNSNSKPISVGSILIT